MTDKEAMKLALEFIERVNKEGWILADFEPQMYQAIAALKERLEDPMREVQRLGQEIEQEPVAWQVMVEDEAMKEFPIKDMAHDWCLHQKLSGSPHLYWIRPLYTHPPQRTEQEPVAWISPSGALYRTRYHAVANAEQLLTPLYLHPPQRKWVDLSDEDIEECFTVTPDLYLKRHIAQRISAKLKDKNT